MSSGARSGAVVRAAPDCWAPVGQARGSQSSPGTQAGSHPVGFTGTWPLAAGPSGQWEAAGSWACCRGVLCLLFGGPATHQGLKRWPGPSPPPPIIGLRSPGAETALQRRLALPGLVQGLRSIIPLAGPPLDLGHVANASAPKGRAPWPRTAPRATGRRLAGHLAPPRQSGATVGVPTLP